MAAPLNDSFILGMDFLKSAGAVIYLTDDSLILGKQKIQAEMRCKNGEHYLVQRIQLDKQVVVPPNTAVKLSTKYKAPPNKTFMVNATGLSHCGAMIPNILMVSAATQGEVNWAPLVVRNDSNKFVCLKKGHLVGLAEEVDLVDGDATGGSNLAGSCSAKDERSACSAAPSLESATRAVTKVPPH